MKYQEVSYMRKLFLLLFFLVFLCGCASTGPQSAYEEGQVLQIDQESVSAGISIECEWTEYALSAPRITFLVKNNTQEEIMTGWDFGLEVYLEDTWHTIPMKENYGFTAEGVILAPGTARAFGGLFSAFDYDFHPGIYRVRKELEGEVFAAEFSMVKNTAVSLASPYGFGPLEDFSESDLKNCLQTENGSITENENLAALFLEKVSLDMDCQLRKTEKGTDGQITVIDIIYENKRFVLRRFVSGDIEEEYYSYIVSDGEDLYLSHCADWDLPYQDTPMCLFPRAASDWIELVEEMTAVRLETNSKRYQRWSPDGKMYVMLTDVPTEFGIGGNGGAMEDLQNYDGLETAIERVAWEGDAVLLTCSTVDGGTSMLRAKLEKNPLLITITPA